jgi:CMP-N-acetylneuraminic acid synthetase
MSFERGAGGVLAVIPARAGSKRLPGKNLLPLGGKPLIAWTIAAAMEARSITDILVSTDSEEIAAEARRHGASAPFLRPRELATDTAASFEVVRHAVEYASGVLGRPCEFTLLLQPTSPLRGSADIQAALDLLAARNADAVVSVCESDHSPLWMNTLPPDRSLDGFLREEVKNRRSQDLPRHYRINGAIYAGRTETLLREGSFFPARNAFAHVMAREDSVDIDDALDFAVAEALLAFRKGR